MSIVNCMADLETFGTKPGCAIRSIGAALFYLDGRRGPMFYCNVDEQSCLDLGLTKEPETVKWWLKQSAEAQAALLVGQVPVAVAVANFIAWYRLNGAKRLWCQGANFDAPILEHIIELLGMTIPWAYWDVRDTRTVYDVFGFNAKGYKRAGTYHNALDDCLHQIECIHAAMSLSRPSNEGGKHDTPTETEVPDAC